MIDFRVTPRVINFVENGIQVSLDCITGSGEFFVEVACFLFFFFKVALVISGLQLITGSAPI